MIMSYCCTVERRCLPVQCVAHFLTDVLVVSAQTCAAVCVHPGNTRESGSREQSLSNHRLNTTFFCTPSPFWVVSTESFQGDTEAGTHRQLLFFADLNHSLFRVCSTDCFNHAGPEAPSSVTVGLRSTPSRVKALGYLLKRSTKHVLRSSTPQPSKQPQKH